jgi:sugar lactone lactonase YvrE
MGVLAEPRSGTLWACSNDMSSIGVQVSGTDTWSALKGFDLKTGKGKISAKLPGEHPLCNDIAVGPDGVVYVTDTVGGRVLRLRPSGSKLEVWCADAKFEPSSGFSLDGIAFGGDGDLYVNTYAMGGFFRVEMKNGFAGRVTRLKTSRSLVNPDGLRALSRNVFLMIEGSGKLDRVTVKGDRALIETIKDGFAGPTGVTITRGTAWVSEGQLYYLSDPKMKGESPHLPFLATAVPLN